jgi:hypothetical protein
MSQRKSKVVRTVKPGQPGTLKYVRRYGDLLVAVRYRYHAARRVRFTTVEVIIDERPWLPGMDFRIALDGLDAPESVLVQASYHETQLRARIRGAGGRWHAEERAWELPLETVKRMGLEGRIVFKSRQGDRSP